MARRTSSQQQAVNPLGPSAVVGLEAGREVARRHQRRRQMKDRIFGTAGAIVALGVVASAAYIGYTIYHETQENERLEIEQRQAELDRDGATILDAIDELEETPHWNGPGNPAFGIGGERDEIDGSEIEIIAPVTLPDSGG
jgi:uncharacterized membrane protein YebE (DUF533 family)